MLRSQVPMVMLWGESGVMVYNDAYAGFSGSRHPALLGMNVREAWPEVADFNDNIMRVGLAGQTLSYRDQELTLDRSGRPEPVWLDLDYSPLLDDAGMPTGVVAIVIETTAKVLAERHLGRERERMALLFEQSPGFMAMLSGPTHEIVLANPSYERLVGARDVVGRTIAEALPETAAQGYLNLLDKVYRSGEAFTAHGARYDTAANDGGGESSRYVDFVFQPIRDASGNVSGIFVEGADVTARVTGERRRDILVALSDALRDLEDPAEIGFAASRVAGEALGVSRVGYGTIDHVAETLHFERDWNAPGVESLAGVVRLRDYGSFIDALKRNEFTVIAASSLGAPARRACARPTRRSRPRSRRARAS